MSDFVRRVVQSGNIQMLLDMTGASGEVLKEAKRQHRKMFAEASDEDLQAFARWWMAREDGRTYEESLTYAQQVRENSRRNPDPV